MNDTSEKPGLKKNWSLTRAAFDNLLRWIDEGTDSQGRGYLAMRSRLVTYFDRKNCTHPDDMADETLNRVGRRLEEEGEISTETPAKYCYTVARFVFLEHLRSPASAEIPLDGRERKGDRNHLADDEDRANRARHEAKLDCLEKCAKTLDDDQRHLIFRYYRGEKRTKIENRRRMAEELGTSLNALGIRVFRIREKLEKCVTECFEAKERN